MCRCSAAPAHRDGARTRRARAGRRAAPRREHRSRRSGASSRQASRSGNTSAVTSSRSAPASTTSRTSGAKCAMNAARSGPTLTQVPVASLKSSARRPSNSKPFGRIGRIVELERVADLVKPFVVEGFRGERGRAPIAGRDVGAFAAAPRVCRSLRHQLQLHARHRQADIAGALAIPRCRRARAAPFPSSRGRRER